MKIKFSGLFLLICILYYGQSDSKYGWGPQIGLNIAYIPEVLEEVKDNDPIPRINFGMFGEMRINEQFSARMEVDLSYQGTNAIFTVDNPLDTGVLDLNADFSLDYVSIPVYLKWHFKDNFSLGGGPFFSFLTKNKVHAYTDPSVLEEFGFSIDVKGNFEEVLQQMRELGRDYQVTLTKNDVGLLGEISYELPLGIGFNARYSQGLVTILKGTDLKIKPRNQVLFFGVYYRF